ncbi:B12-binding protein [Desulfosarcina alkanivorans]|uniref:B12-binding protein n=1 Tax=Desulfosarcina alkanivorans TaxID=571177 RepID=A0A5K7YPF3_9BACT|nr:TIGR03960 family B12-binding radical SAM protein [Desulfosarcina alkanivorans]BBO70205.1 B12-binding protein [Desulfosarcina alkanivorans]
MSKTTIQDILPLIQMPSRYLGSEVNRIKKSWEKTHLHMALAFPDLYEIACSHFGIQILYEMLNARHDILAERVFSPAVDMEKQLREKKMPLCSLESETPVKKFDIVGFSLLYELNYTNMVNMLDLSGIVFFSRQRGDEDPFIIAGGPCTCNPEPVAEFFDAIVVGDGEAVIYEITDAWKAWRESENRERNDLLQRWSRIKGVYVPSFFDIRDEADGSRRSIPKNASYQYVERAVVSDLNDAPFPTSPIIPFGRPVHDRLRMEIARGCTRGCRFCQAGMIYRPVRERQPEAIVDSVGRSLEETGYEDLSLLSLSTGDYSCIAPLLKTIMDYGQNDRVAVSLPSLRAGSLTPELMGLIKKVRKTGFTIAPEAGSQRLRDVINKNISESDILETVENAFSLGWKIIKLYFMIGLPTERQEDIEAIVALVKRLKSETKKKSRSGKINVSVATFVPKPHTPFQWEPQIDLETALYRINWLKSHLKMAGVQVKWQDPRVSMVEGVWARGDRRLNRVLINAWKKGCRFDGWTDFFDYDRWMVVFKESGINPIHFTQGWSEPDTALPWDHIHIGVERSFLWNENERAKDGNLTDDCRTGLCSGCGVCDFKSIQPVSYHDKENHFYTANQKEEVAGTETIFKYIINFRKMSTARFLGHLEMVKIFIRGLRREKIPLKYSKGYHPMPKVSFGDTLPMGMQSEDETLLVSLTEAMNPEELKVRISRQMPEGLDITGCTTGTGKETPNRGANQHYRVELKDGFFLQKELEWFVGQQSVTIERKSKKGKNIVVDLKRAVSDIGLVNRQEAFMILGTDNNLMVRPAHVMKTVFKLTDQQILKAIITKRKTNHV